MKLGKGVLYKKLCDKRGFRENRLSGWISLRQGRERMSALLSNMP